MQKLIGPTLLVGFLVLLVWGSMSDAPAQGVGARPAEQPGGGATATATATSTSLPMLYLECPGCVSYGLGNPTPVAVGNGPGPGNCPNCVLQNQKFWASIDGPGTDNRNGDPYNTRFIHSENGFVCPNGNLNMSIPNPAYVAAPDANAGYNYAIQVDASQGDIGLYVYDPAQYYRSGVNGTAGDTGDTQLCAPVAATRYRYRTYFQLYEPDNTPDDLTDDIPMGSPVSFQDDGTTAYHNKWFLLGTLPASLAANGRFRLQVYTDDMNAAGTYGAGQNQYSLALGGPREPDNVETISPLLRSSLFNNIRQFTGGDIGWYLTQIASEHAGERVSFMFYDPGDAQCNTSLQLFRESDPTNPVPFDLNWTGTIQTNLPTTDTSYPPGDPRRQPYDGQWVTLGVTLPANYTDDYWKLKYIIAGCAMSVTDRITWQASFPDGGGTPTPTATLSPTPTATPTNTPSPSATPTRTATPLPSATATRTATLPPSATRTATLPPSATRTPTPTPPPSTTPTPTVGCGDGWHLVASPNEGTNNNSLAAVAAVGANDVWAVGSYVDGVHISQSLIQHWDGSSWTTVPSFATNASDNALTGVAAVAANDIWAVGYVAFCCPTQPLLLHWDGVSWTPVVGPVMAVDSRLTGVAAVAANDVWAVGTTGSATLTLHWNGTDWAVVPSPNVPSQQNLLTAVAAVGHNDVWAVGNAIESGNANHTLTMHWNGTAWTIVPSPDIAARYNQLNAVTAIGPNDVWAIGQALPGGVPNTWGVLPLHWDGSVWTAVTPPNYSAQDTIAYGATNFGPNNLWLVGTYTVPSRYDPMTVQRSNNQWTQAQSPHIGDTYNFLNGVAGSAANDIWAVGFYQNASGSYRTLIEHYTGGCGTPTPTVTGTPPTATATRIGTPLPTATVTRTRTPVPPATVTRTGTPPTTTPTATVCPLQFNDVPTGSTFYDYVHCLACRGLVSGYPCGGPGEPCPGTYYRPNNNVTRGQLAKIIAGAAGLSDPVSGQTFEDVLPGSTFYEPIERLAGRGVIGGYPCGGAGEPCQPPGNRPYFRPNAPATRGQIAKIVSNTAPFTETPTGQTFEDAPPGSTFYLYIERIASRGIVSGYPCGGAGEPCLPPGNRPYFRPGSQTTRGQMSKIAAATFLPNCQTPAGSRQ